jgi:hypothetical protein
MLKARLHCLAPLPELRSLAPCALPAAQALFLALPDELLGSILRRAWADRPPRPAGEEVRAAAGLALVCRRVRALLRERPLPLALDFSAARLGDEQRRWLLEPAQAGRVEAAMFCVLWEPPRVAKDALWERPLLDNFLALHGATLLQLSGVPLQLVACASHMARPALDLSGLRLAKLGIECCGVENLTGNSQAERLWPEYLPGALEELDLLGLYDTYLTGRLTGLAWASRSGAGVAGRLPRLHTIRLRAYAIAYETANEIDRPLSFHCPPILEGFTSLLHLEVDGSGAPISCHDVAIFDKVRSARIVSDGLVYLWVGEQGAAAAADRLCHARLQAAELRAARDGIQIYRRSRGTEYGSEKLITRELVVEMIGRCGDRFAVKVEISERPDGSRWCEHDLRRLAWRRWPAPGAPDLPAATAAHERARAWATAGGPPYDW